MANLDTNNLMAPVQNGNPGHFNDPDMLQADGSLFYVTPGTRPSRLAATAFTKTPCCTGPPVLQATHPMMAQ